MADNPSIDPGTTPTLPVEGDDVGAGVIRQGVVVSWGAKDASVRVTAAAPMPVVQTGTPALPTGAAADATLTANGVLTGSLTETAPATDTASSGLNGRLQRIAQRLSTIIGVLPTALGANGGLKIEGVASGTVVPISGTVTSTPSGTQTVSGTVGVSGNVATTSAAASQADGHSAAIGATTDAAATTTGSVIAQLRRVANLLAGTLTVSGTVTTSPPSNASSNTAQIAGTATSVNSGTVDAGTQRVADAGANTGTLTNVAGSATSVTILASNTARRGGAVWNDSTSILYLKFGATASATSATVKLVADAYWEIPANYNGLISGIWVSATGTARVTEITA